MSIVSRRGQTARESFDAERNFDGVLLWFETGHFKLPPKAWQQVIDRYGRDPGDICFRDDADRNILAARPNGLPLFSVRGEEAVPKLVKELTGNLKYFQKKGRYIPYRVTFTFWRNCVVDLHSQLP